MARWTVKPPGHASVTFEAGVAVLARGNDTELPVVAFGETESGDSPIVALVALGPGTVVYREPEKRNN